MNSAADRETVSAVVRVIRELRPEVVLGHDPWKRYRLHPDHRAAGLLVCDGIVAARDPTSFRSTASPITGRRRCSCGRPTSPTTSRTSRDTVAAKLDALEAHESQFETTMHASDAGCSSSPSGSGSELGWRSSAHRSTSTAGEIFRLMTDL